MCTTPGALRALSTANAPTRCELLKIVVATSLLNGLEIFDFTVFGFFAAMIGEQFFPARDPLTSLLLAVGTFGAGFLMRPVGAMVIGAYADRAGRRNAMTATSAMMALGTAALAFCPPFAVLGVAAPLVVVAARLLQGFASGGEVGASTSFVMEAGPASSRGSRVSWQLASQGAAALLGAALGTLLSRTMAPAALAGWGWRIPFVIGLLVAPVGFYMRYRLSEPAAAVGHDAARSVAGPGYTVGGRARSPLAELFGEHRVTLALATLMIIGRTVPIYAIVFYMPSYLSRVMHMPASTGYLSSTLSALLLLVVSPLSGLLADRLPRRKPMALFTSACTALLIYPMFLLIVHAHSVWPILLGVGVISTLIALGASVSTVLVLEALSPRVRASGIAISYALGVALFGGTAQFVVTALIRWTGDPMSAAWYVTPACCVSVCALALFRERRAPA
jgi:MFS transporter, MHS family, proline/betaine transporter